MSQSNQPTQYNDEITLKELIQILLSQKWLIVGITAMTLILAAIYTFLMVDPVYESKAVLNAAPIGTESIIEGNIESIVNNSDLYPVSTVETYMEQLVSPQLLARVIDQLGLTNAEGAPMSITSLRNKLTISNVDNTNLLEITVTSTDPIQAEQIANTLASSFIKFIDEAGKSQSSETAAKIEAQLVIEESNLAVKSQNLADFMAESVSISELNSEINSLVSQITSIKSTLNSLQVSINSDKVKLETLAPQLKDTSIVFDSLELASDGTTSVESLNLDELKDSELADNLVAIEFINTQNTYVGNLASYDAYREQLTLLDKDLIDKQSLLVEEGYKYDRLNREVELAKQTYNAYQNRYQEAIVAAAAEIGSNNIVISSEAIVPEKPTGPNKTLNLAIGLVLGGMVGVFMAFFRAYWKNA